MQICHEYALVAGDAPCEKMTAAGQCVRVDGQVSWIKLPRHEMEQRAAGTRGGNKNICRMEPRHETGASHVTPSQVTLQRPSSDTTHLRQASGSENSEQVCFSFLPSEPEVKCDLILRFWSESALHILDALCIASLEAKYEQNVT